MATLRDLRLRLFLTQTQLAALVGVPYQTVQRWESGRSTPRPGGMRELARALDVTGEELLAAIRETKAAGA